MADQKKSENLQNQTLETLSSHIKRIEDYSEELSKKGIIISTEINVEPYKEDKGVTKTPVVWPLIDYGMFYIVDVPENSDLAKHSHDESIFRILLSGSLTINGITIDKPGTWYVVPAYTEYEISTKTGYSVLSGYTSICRTGKEQALQNKEDK